MSIISGMSAFFGGLAVVYIGKPTNFLLGHMLSFASGVMLYISYGDLLRHAEESLGENGYFISNCWFFIGMAFFYIIINLIPEPDFDNIIDKPKKSPVTTPKNSKRKTSKSPKSNGLRKRKNSDPKDTITVDDEKKESHTSTKSLRNKLWTTGLVSALGITLHNFPEGLIVFNASVVSIFFIYKLGPCDSTGMMDSISNFMNFLFTCMGRGVAVTLAIGLHNIPEGIAVTLPIYAATGEYILYIIIVKLKH